MITVTTIFIFLGFDVALDGPKVESNSVIFYCNVSVTTGRISSKNFKVRCETILYYLYPIFLFCKKFTYSNCYSISRECSLFMRQGAAENSRVI